MDGTLVATPWSEVVADWLVIPLTEPLTWSAELKKLDQAWGGILARLETSQELPLKKHATLVLKGLSGAGTSRCVLVGLGNPESASPPHLERAFLTATRLVTDKAGQKLAYLIPPRDAIGIDSAAVARAMIYASRLASVGQDLYRTEKGRYPLASVQLVTGSASSAEIQAAVDEGQILGDAVNLARDLVNRPPAELTPASFAQRAVALAQQTGLHCEVWDQTRLLQERMRALLAVAQGSTQPPRLVLMEHRAGGDAPTIALVGKGVTFDSGGLSLKPTDGMLTMKCDMAGAATVLGAMVAIARLKLPVNVIGAMGLVENMPGGNAFKLGDILTARNGVTIEVLNTDAEGRLVLADVLSLIQERQPSRIIDLATLTGACVVALGEDVAGLMSNHDGWARDVQASAGLVGEDLWPLPMYDFYDDLIKGDVGDIKNTGGRWGGAITAAKFLQRFVGQTPWVHLDIAGPAFASSGKPYRDAGGTGAFVKTLVQVVRQHATVT